MTKKELLKQLGNVLDSEEIEIQSPVGDWYDIKEAKRAEDGIATIYYDKGKGEKEDREPQIQKEKE